MKFERLLKVLADNHVAFIIIGGVAGSVHGSAHATYDLDVVYSRDAANINLIAEALAPLHPYLRGAPPGLPFEWSAATLAAGLNFTLTTDAGDLDIFGEVVGGGRYEELLPHTVEVDVFSVTCRCVDLDTLILLKRAAGRPRDFNMVAELEALREEIARAKGQD